MPMAHRDSSNHIDKSDNRLERIKRDSISEEILDTSQPKRDVGPVPMSPSQHGGNRSTFDVVTRIVEIAIGAIVGGALVWIGWSQYSVYTQQASIMRAQNSAYVWLERIETAGFDTPNSPFYFRAIFKNTGNGLANIAFGYTNFYYPDSLIPGDYDFRNLRGSSSFKYIVAPQGEMISHAVEISRSVINDVIDRKKPLYAYGAIVYRDSYSSHKMMFCLVVSGVNTQTGDLKSGIKGFIFAPCERHNCIDDDCKSEPTAGLSPPP